jgi:UrcA family protein
MIRRYAVMAAAAVALAMAADAAVSSVAVRGMAPIEDGGFQLRQTTVHYGDLNINSRKGADRLLALIDKAAADSCATPDMPTEKIKAEVRQCRTTAVKHAIAKVHSPELTMVANAR